MVLEVGWGEKQEGVKWGLLCSGKYIGLVAKSGPKKKREEQENLRGEGNRSCGLWMNPSGSLLGGVIPSSGLSLADSARAEELSVAEGACS